MKQAAKTVVDNVIRKGDTPLEVDSTPLLFNRFIQLVTVLTATNDIREDPIHKCQH